jgi:hypothetical protein
VVLEFATGSHPAPGACRVRCEEAVIAREGPDPTAELGHVTRQFGGQNGHP